MDVRMAMMDGALQKFHMNPRNVRLFVSSAAVLSLLSYAVVLLVTPACNNEIAAHYRLSLSQLGQLSLATMLGFFVTVVPAGVLADRLGKLPLMTVGCLSMSAGATVFFLLEGFGWAVVGAALFGIGGGFSEATSMALLADLYEGRSRSTAMNLAQATFGIGVVIAPAGVGWILRLGGEWRTGYLGALLICLFGALINLVALSLHREKRLPLLSCHASTLAITRDFGVWIFALGILLYVGAEIGQSTWLSVYFKRYFDASDSLAASSPSFMWLGIGIGRFLAAYAVRHIRDVALIRLALIGASICQLLLLILKAPVPGAVSAFALGIFLGPVFPTIVSCANSGYQGATGSVSSIVMAAGSLGAAVFPPLIGWSADLFSLRQALWVCFVALVADYVLFRVVAVRS
ncbi:MAG: MFS transporter [Armatimonadota bacterium]